MAHRFVVPDSSPPGSPTPSTPDRTQPRGSKFSFLGEAPSTTPAGPPPSSAASFTPAGAPTNSFMGSSTMGAPEFKPLSFGTMGDASAQNPFGRPSNPNAPLGRSIRGRAPPTMFGTGDSDIGRIRRGPSGLSHQFSAGDDEGEDVDAEGEDELPPHPGSLFRPYGAGRGAQDEAEAEIIRLLDEEMADHGNHSDRGYDENDGEGSEPDLFLNMRHDDRVYGQPAIGDESDLLMLNTPAATERVRREAEDIFKRSSAHFGTSTRKQGLQFASIAKDLYTRHQPARVVEPAKLILGTEDLVCKLYQEGVGTEDNAEKMDQSLATITTRLVSLWNQHVEELPQPEGEDFATIGPGPQAAAFEKAAYVAHLMLRMHHTRFDPYTEDEKTPPLPEVLFDWMQSSHNMYPDQIREINRYKPSPASHHLFWETLRCTLLRGDVRGASQLLRNAGWEHVRRGPHGEFAYNGKALENVRRFAATTCEILDQCPATRSEWDIWDSNWTLFRVQARGALDRLTLFAEGKGQGANDSFNDDLSPQPQSLSTLARKAASQIPWDVYENLQTVYGILLGKQESILEVAQDWCEGTIGLMGWWDNGVQRHKALKVSHAQAFPLSASRSSSSDDYFERLATAFHVVIASDLNPNPLNPVEVAMASAFEGNVNAVLGFLRMWSLPLACTVAEVASLGNWLPATESAKPFSMDALDLDDLELLGISPPGPDELEGIKDTTLVLYARELAGISHLSAEQDGWEMAIHVLGRMDSPEKSETTVGELLRDLLATLDEGSSMVVDKIWRILNDLGMINYAEETAETFAEILSKQSHRYGEALWYYALSHRPDSVRTVLNLLMSYSLVQSTAYPLEQDLDSDLKDLLRKRTETLEKRANQDLEAAQLLGRMLSGYATLRKFYETRDSLQLDDVSPTKALKLKKEAASALVAVIASADDNIRGGLYDETRDAVVSEDFLLALLAEATVFVNQSPVVITLGQIDILLKAIEDIQTVGERVYSACADFLEVVLSSGQGLKGSSPWDLMQKSTGSLSGSSYIMSGSSLLVNHLQKMTSGAKLQRGWDWRHGWVATTKGSEVLRRLRLGLNKDLATLWLEDADGVAIF